MLDELAEAKARFVAGVYDDALARLHSISSRSPLETEPLAVMTLCYHSLGQTAHARRLWKIVVSRDARYLLPRFLRKELGWADALLTTAAKVSAMVV